MSLLKRIETQQQESHAKEVEQFNRVLHDAESSIRTDPLERYSRNPHRDAMKAYQEQTADALHALATGEAVPVFRRKPLNIDRVVTTAYSQDKQRRIEIIEDNVTGEVVVSLFKVAHNTALDSIDASGMNLDPMATRFNMKGKRLLTRIDSHIDIKVDFAPPCDAVKVAEVQKIPSPNPEGKDTLEALRKAFFFEEQAPVDENAESSTKDVRTWLPGKPIDQRINDVVVLAVHGACVNHDFAEAFSVALQVYIETEFPEAEEPVKGNLAGQLFGFVRQPSEKGVQPPPFEDSEAERELKLSTTGAQSKPTTASLIIAEMIEEKRLFTQRSLGILRHLQDIAQLRPMVVREAKLVVGDIEKERQLNHLSHVFSEISTVGMSGDKVRIDELAKEIYAGTPPNDVVVGIESTVITPEYTYYLRSSIIESGKISVRAITRNYADKSFEVVISEQGNSENIRFVSRIKAILG